MLLINDVDEENAQVTIVVFYHKWCALVVVERIRHESIESEYTNTLHTNSICRSIYLNMSEYKALSIYLAHYNLVCQVRE